MKFPRTLPVHRLIGLLIAGSCLFGGGSNAFADHGLGRLFFTPEQRQQLDRQRTLNALKSGQLDDNPQLVIDGLVRRSSGRHTVWINGHAQDGGEPRMGTAARPDPRDPAGVLIEGGDVPLTALKVGDTLHSDTREASNALGNGRIVVRRLRTGDAR